MTDTNRAPWPKARTEQARDILEEAGQRALAALGLDHDGPALIDVWMFSFETINADGGRRVIVIPSDPDRATQLEGIAHRSARAVSGGRS